MINRLLGLTTMLFLSALVHSQLAYRFRNFSITDGLSQSSVTCIVQDDVGTLWFGTSNGLTGYDQNKEQFITYGVGSNNPLSIEAIAEAGNGDLWLGTSTQGLVKWENKTRKLKLVNSKFPSKRILFVRFLDDN